MSTLKKLIVAVADSILWVIGRAAKSQLLSEVSEKIRLIANWPRH